VVKRSSGAPTSPVDGSGLKISVPDDQGRQPGSDRETSVMRRRVRLGLSGSPADWSSACTSANGRDPASAALARRPHVWDAHSAGFVPVTASGEEADVHEVSPSPTMASSPHRPKRVISQLYAARAQRTSASAHRTRLRRRLKSSASAEAASRFAGIAVSRASTATLSRMSTFFVS
jgi:hypothetical protein